MCFSYEYLKKKKKKSEVCLALIVSPITRKKSTFRPVTGGEKKDAETFHAIKQNILILD